MFACGGMMYSAGGWTVVSGTEAEYPGAIYQIGDNFPKLPARRVDLGIR